MEMINKIAMLAMVSLFALAGCQSRNEESSGPEKIADTDVVTLSENQLKSVGITLGKVEKKSVTTSFQANGTLDVPPQNMISISAPMGGVVKSTSLLEGMRVKKGEVLATLENQEYIQLQQDYLQNLSKLQFAEAEYKRQQELASENVNAQKTLQLSKAEFEGVQALVKGLEARLRMININPASIGTNGIRSEMHLYAPQAGYVTSVNVNVGQNVNPSEPICRIVNLEHLHVELFVFEKDVYKVRPGQKITYSIPNETEKRTGSVYLVGREIGADRTIRIHCHMDKEDEDLLPGMFVTASVFIETIETDVVPASAIANFQGDKFIFVALTNNSFRSIPVKTGTMQEDYIQVFLPENFSRDSRVVVSNPFPLMGLMKNTEDEEH
jgi:membrane fusion protein, heavy metal efflux system